MLFRTRTHLTSEWPDLAEDRLRLDRLSRNDGDKAFFPWANAHSSRKTRKPCRHRPPLRCGPRAGASSIVLGPSIAIEAAVVVGLNSKEK